MREPQPNSLHCFVCGMENPIGLHLRFYQTTKDEVTAECTLPEKYQGYPGVVHGGVVAAMLDEAAGRVYMGEAGSPRFMYTAKLQVRYRKNVPIGQPLRLVGRALKNKSRAATATSIIYDQNGAVLAEGEALLMDVPQPIVQGVDLETLGWRIYDEIPAVKDGDGYDR